MKKTEILKIFIGTTLIILGFLLGIYWGYCICAEGGNGFSTMFKTIITEIGANRN